MAGNFLFSISSLEYFKEEFIINLILRIEKRRRSYFLLYLSRSLGMRYNVSNMLACIHAGFLDSFDEMLNRKSSNVNK